MSDRCISSDRSAASTALTFDLYVSDCQGNRVLYLYCFGWSRIIEADDIVYYRPE